MSKQTEELERVEALRLFRLVQGPGDAGDESAFDAMTEADEMGWLKLARLIMQMAKTTEGLTHQIHERDRNIRTLTQDRDLALADASKWRDHVTRFYHERFPREVMCCQVSTQLFFTLEQQEREQFLQEQIIRAVGDLFHRLSPEESLRQMLRKPARTE